MVSVKQAPIGNQTELKHGSKADVIRVLTAGNGMSSPNTLWYLADD